MCHVVVAHGVYTCKRLNHTAAPQRRAPHTECCYAPYVPVLRTRTYVATQHTERVCVYVVYTHTPLTYLLTYLCLRRLKLHYTRLLGLCQALFCICTPIVAAIAAIHGDYARATLVLQQKWRVSGAVMAAAYTYCANRITTASPSVGGHHACCGAMLRRCRC